MPTITAPTTDKLALTVRRIIIVWVAACLLSFGLGVATRFLVDDTIEVVASIIRKVFHYPTNSTPTPKPQSTPGLRPESGLNTKPTLEVEHTSDFESESESNAESTLETEFTLGSEPTLKEKSVTESEPTPELESTFAPTSVEELASLKMSELRRVARSLKIKGINRLSKAKLIELLTEALLAEPAPGFESTS